MTATDRVCVDNVLVYAHDRGEPKKGPVARKLLSRLVEHGRPMVSIQILSEFYWTVTRKISTPLTHDEAAAEIERLQLLLTVVPVTIEVLENAMKLIGTHQLPLWDAQVVAVADLHQAHIVLSEDFQHRGTIAGVKFLNPFADDFDISEVLAKSPNRPKKRKKK